MQKFALSLIASAVLGLASMSAQADFIGVYAGVDGYFNKSNVSEGSNTDTKLVGAYSLAFEHPVPFIPNGKVRYSKISNSTSNLIINTNVGPASYDDKFTLENLDMIAYYEVLDNVVSIDLGLGAKKINSTVNYSARAYSTGQIINGTDKYSDTIPAVYASAGGKLPFTGFSAKAEVFAGKKSDVDFTDYNAEVKYDFVETLLVNVGAKVGYRNMKVNVDNSALVSQLTMKGPYLGLEAHF